MANALNTYQRIASLANPVQEMANLAFKDFSLFLNIQNMVTVKMDQMGGNPRKFYEYTEGAFNAIGETDDLTSQVIEPSVLATLTPVDYGMQYFITDKRANSELPEMLMADAARSIGEQAALKAQRNIVGLFSSFTGGTIGTAGGTITWKQFFAASSIARTKAKNPLQPLWAVLHEYQWNRLAAAASVAGGTSVAYTPEFNDGITAQYYRGRAGGVEIFVITDENNIDASDDFTAGVFSPDAIVFDEREALRVEPERDASRRGTELNGYSLYAHGLWYADHGVQLISDASVPTGS